MTVCFGVLLVAAIVDGVAHAIVSLTLIGTAVMLAVALDHAVVMLQHRGVNRSLAIAIISLSMLGLVVALGFTLIPPAVEQGRQLIHDAPSFLRQARGSSLFHRLDGRFHLDARVTLAEQKLPEMLEGAATPILSALGGVLTALGAAVTVSVLVVFMLIFGGRLVRAMLAEARPEHVAAYEDVLGKIYQSIGGYLGGLALICTVNATLTTSLPGDRRRPLLPAARDPLRDVEHGPLRRARGGGDRRSRSSRSSPRGPGTGSPPASTSSSTARSRGTSSVRWSSVGPCTSTRWSPPCRSCCSARSPGVVGAVVAVPVVATLQIILREILQNRRDQLKIAPPARQPARPRRPVSAEEPVRMNAACGPQRELRSCCWP